MIKLIHLHPFQIYIERTNHDHSRLIYARCRPAPHKWLKIPMQNINKFSFACFFLSVHFISISPANFAFSIRSLIFYLLNPVK